jgi:hypothetical protein
MFVINYCIGNYFLFDIFIAATMLNAVFVLFTIVLINFNVYLVYSVLFGA